MAKPSALRTPSNGGAERNTPAGRQSSSALTKAIIIAAHGRHYLALADGVLLQCVTRGKKSDIAVGDHVNLLTPKRQA